MNETIRQSQQENNRKYFEFDPELIKKEDFFLIIDKKRSAIEAEELRERIRERIRFKEENGSEIF